MKILHMPNERHSERHKMELASRVGFEYLLEKGSIEGYKVYSFLRETEQKGIETVAKEIEHIVATFKPTVIYWQHISEFDPGIDFFVRIKEHVDLLVYQDDDAYGVINKPISKTMKNIIKVADLVLASGSGHFVDLYRFYGAKKVRYFTHCFDSERYPEIWDPKTERDIPVVMIASMFHSKVPFKFMPGAGKRKRLALKMDRRFGENFYLYGSGWKAYDLKSARGFLPYDQQLAVLRNSWLSINWDHFDNEAGYFSDRLPISLASGTPHITCRHRGYDQIFRGCLGGLYLVDSPSEAVEVATYLLSRPPEFLIEEGKKSFDFAYRFLESRVVYEELVQLFNAELLCGK